MVIFSFFCYVSLSASLGSPWGSKSVFGSFLLFLFSKLDTLGTIDGQTWPHFYQRAKYLLPEGIGMHESPQKKKIINSLKQLNQILVKGG